MDLLNNFKNKGITFAFVVALAPLPALAQESDGRDARTQRDLSAEECEQYIEEKEKLVKTKKFVQHNEDQPGSMPKVPEGVSAEWNAEKAARLEKVNRVIEEECV